MVEIRRATSFEEARQVLAAAARSIDTPTQRQLFSDEHQAASFARGARKPQWVWSAHDGDRRVGVVAGWGPERGGAPWLLDFFDLPADDPEVGEALLRRAIDDTAALGEDELEIDLFVPLDGDPQQIPAAARVLRAAAATGFEPLVSRYRYELDTAGWTGSGPTDLRYATADEDELLDVYRRILEGTLDAHSRRALETTDAAAVAADELAEVIELEGADHVYVARDAGGDPVGLIAGTIRGAADRGVAGFVGVVPEHRGRGHATELLGWITARLIEDGARTVIGETDTTNIPMDKAFTRTGYPRTERRLDLVARLGDA